MRDHSTRSVVTKEGFERWRSSGESMYLIRFEVVELTPEGERQKTALLEQGSLFTPQEVLVCR